MQRAHSAGKVKLNLLGQFVVAAILIGLIPAALISYSAIMGYYNAGQQGADVAHEELNRLAVSALQVRVQDAAQSVSVLLERGVQDTLAAAGLARTNPGYQYFQQTREGELWYPAGTSAAPREERRQVPLYREIDYIDANGQERLRVRDGQIVAPDQLRNVSDPANTTYRSETYFADTKRLPRGQVYVSH